MERLAAQPPSELDDAAVAIEPLRAARRPAEYTQDDLHVRQFSKNVTRRLVRKGQFRAA
jgi:hypothetical protein